VSQDSKYYPVMESVVDGFGNAADVSDPERGWPLDTELVLQVGQTVTFNCRGWDAQGRELTWRVVSQWETLGAIRTGNEVQLEFVVTEDHVGVHFFVDVEMTSSGKFHRHTRHDQNAQFFYTVEPPAE